MLADIQWAFSTLVRSADWMDEDTKVATLDKATAVKQFIGFPEWLLEKDHLQEYYEGVSKPRHLKSQTFGLFWSYVFQNNTPRLGGPGSSVCIATGYRLHGPGIESRWGQDFSRTSRPALGPTQPSVQWIPRLSRG
jgi:hypothetical protein